MSTIPAPTDNLQRKLRDLLDRRKTATDAMEEVMVAAAARGAGNDDLSGEELQTWTRARDEAAALTVQVEAHREHLGVQGTINRQEIPDAPGDGARGDVLASSEYREAFVGYLRRGLEGLGSQHRELLEEARANLPQASGTDELGGFLVPVELANRIIETAHTFNSVVQAGATVQTTASGSEIQFPTADDDGDEGEIIGENVAVGEEEIDFGLKAIKAHIFSSKMVKVPRSLLTDAGVDLESYVSGRLGKRIGRRQGRAYTVGTGASQPEGIVTAATVGKTAASATATTYAELVDLKFSVDEAYRERARWLFKDTTLAALMKLLDADQRPLLSWSVTVDTPDTILGRPFTTSAFMPEMAASEKSILFGDYAGYFVREVNGVTILRLLERFAEKFQIGFIGFHRADAALLDSGCVRALKQAA